MVDIWNLRLELQKLLNAGRNACGIMRLWLRRGLSDTLLWLLMTLTLISLTLASWWTSRFATILTPVLVLIVRLIASFLRSGLVFLLGLGSWSWLSVDGVVSGNRKTVFSLFSNIMLHTLSDYCEVGIIISTLVSRNARILEFFVNFRWNFGLKCYLYCSGMMFKYGICCWNWSNCLI